LLCVIVFAPTSFWRFEMAAKKAPAKKMAPAKKSAPKKSGNSGSANAAEKRVMDRKKSKPVEPGDAYSPSKTGDMGRQRAAARMNRPDREWNRIEMDSPTTGGYLYDESTKRKMIANFAYGSAKNKKKK
jgi:hypothetical protein